MIARQIGQEFDVAKNVAARKITVPGRARFVVLHDLDHPAVDDVNRVGRIAGAVNFLLRLRGVAPGKAPQEPCAQSA